MKRKLRIGLLIDSYLIPAWSYLMLQRILCSKNIEIVLIVKNNIRFQNSEYFLKKIWTERNHLFWKLYSKFENKLYKPQPNALEQKKIQDIVASDIIDVQSEKLNGSEAFNTEDISTIKGYNIDVLVNLCFIPPTGNILNIPKYGIWSYCHGDRSINRGGPPGAWEVFKNQDKIGAILEILSEKLNGGLRLATSYSATEKLSVNRTNNGNYWKALSLLPRKLEELYELGEMRFFEKLTTENNQPEFFDNPILTIPTNIEVFSAFYRIYSEKIISMVQNYFYFDQWVLLFKFEEEKAWSTSFHQFKRIVPPKDRFWADPFIWLKDGHYYIFLEELVYNDKIGKIAVIKIDENGNHEAPEVVLEQPYHLSYPFLIEENDELFMIPETAGNKTIELYRCIDFPLKWELHKVLMKDVYAVDTTILKYDDKFWLFCNICENMGASALDELFLFYSDSLLTSEWKSHSCNPIVSDVRRSRPAGNIFKNNGQLYRPSQNSEKGYGHGMKINRIIELTTTTYREETVQSIFPHWRKDIISTHTINYHNKLTVIDALVRVRK